MAGTCIATVELGNIRSQIGGDPTIERGIGSVCSGNPRGHDQSSHGVMSGVQPPAVRIGAGLSVLTACRLSARPVRGSDLLREEPVCSCGLASPADVWGAKLTVSTILTPRLRSMHPRATVGVYRYARVAPGTPFDHSG